MRCDGEEVRCEYVVGGIGGGDGREDWVRDAESTMRRKFRGGREG